MKLTNLSESYIDSRNPNSTIVDIQNNLYDLLLAVKSDKNEINKWDSKARATVTLQDLVAEATPVDLYFNGPDKSYLTYNGTHKLDPNDIYKLSDMGIYDVEDHDNFLRVSGAGKPNP